MENTNLQITQEEIDNSLIANASYANLSSNMSATDYYINLVKNGFTHSQAKAFAGLTASLDDNGRIVTNEDNQIQYSFVEKQGYEILATSDELGVGGLTTGYSGVLFKDKDNGTLHFSNRGTTPSDFIRDIAIADVIGIVKNREAT